MSRPDFRLWQARLAGAAWLALILFALFGMPVVHPLPTWMIAIVAAAGVVLGGLCFLPRWLIGRRNPDYAAGRSFLAFAVAGVLVAVGLASLPIYYLAYWVEAGPSALPLATLSNGRKTVVFQGMQHVGSETFYKSVVFDLEKALVEGYTLFYEGVQPVPGRPDLDAWFNDTLVGSGKDLEAGYVKLAEQCGLKFQLTYFKPLLADYADHPSRHVTADVTYLDMKNEYDRLVREDPAFDAAMAAREAARRPGASDETVAGLLQGAADLTRDQKTLLGIVCRGVLALSLSGRLGNADDAIQRVIIDFRNKALARTVAESPAERIYITYGAAHFPGFVEELKALDPGFAIRTLKGVRPMSTPGEARLPK